jgi:hypothetical protein
MENQTTGETLTTLTQGHWHDAMDLFRTPATELPIVMLMRFKDVPMFDRDMNPADENAKVAPEYYSTATYYPHNKKLVIDNPSLKDFTLHQYIRIN